MPPAVEAPAQHLALCQFSASACLSPRAWLRSAVETRLRPCRRQGDWPSQIMSESYIQNLFAERIGGSQYGKSQAIYKFEKIKRAKRAAMAAHPGAEIIDLGIGEPDEMAFPEVVEKLCAEARQAGEPRLRGQRRRGPETSGGPLPGASVRRQGHQPGDRGDPLDRQQGGAVDPAGGAHQPGGLCADDGAGLPDLRHARQVSRRTGAQSAADRGERLSAGPGAPCPRRC